MVTNKLIRNLIQLEGRYTRFDVFCQFAKRFSNQLVGLAHQLYLVLSLQKYLHESLVSIHTATATNTSRVKQAVIVTHEQVTLNLLQCVEHHTNENQQ